VIGERMLQARKNPDICTPLRVSGGMRLKYRLRCGFVRTNGQTDACRFDVNVPG
jgi:hypothetical protein